MLETQGSDSLFEQDNQHYDRQYENYLEDRLGRYGY